MSSWFPGCRAGPRIIASLANTFSIDDKTVVSFRSLDSCRSQLQNDVMNITSNKLQKAMRLELIVNNTLDEGNHEDTRSEWCEEYHPNLSFNDCADIAGW